MKRDMQRILNVNIIRLFFASVLLICGLMFSLSACRSAPPAEEIEEIAFLPPLTVLEFQSIEADSPEALYLSFELSMENHNHMDIPVILSSYQVEINGTETVTGFDLVYPEEAFILEAASTEEDGETGKLSFPLLLGMDVLGLVNIGLAPHDEYEVKLIINYEYFDNQSLQRTYIAETAVFPGVVRPVFDITAIAILQAELINTGFRVGISIQNDNPYPVELAAFSYTLYGDGRLWADGSERNIIGINGKTTLRGDIFLVMNFIDMSRSLLDQIIRLEDVNYRFTGEAVVHTGVYYLPSFTTDFDLTGYSVVLSE